MVIQDVISDCCHPDIPRGPIDAQMDDLNEDDDLIPPDVRRPQRLLDSRRQDDGELSDSDDEGEGGRRDHKSHREPEVASQSGRRFGTAVGIMSTGSTHGIGPTMALPVSANTAAAAAAPSGSSAVSEMDVDDDEKTAKKPTPPKPAPPKPQPPSQAKESAPADSGSNAMAVDPPASAPSS